MVGREAERAQLHEFLEKALSGKRQIVFLTGEAGIGKTTLVEEFLRQAVTVQDLRVAKGQCLELYGVGEAYLPVLEALGQVCRKPGGETLVSALADTAPTWLLQMPSLLSDAERERLQSEVFGATRERMLREAAETIEALSTKRGFVLVLEDLQWSDYATPDLLSLLARRQEPACLLLIGTYRPVDLLVSGHPLRGVKQALYQNVLYQRVAAVRRVRLHQQIGECEEAAYRGREREVAGELAVHFEQGRDYARAVTYLWQAAANALPRYANREASSYLTRALNLVAQLADQAEQMRLHLTILQLLGVVRRSLGDSQKAAEDFLALAAYARAKNQSEWEVKALLYAATTLSWIDHERCLAIAKQAMALSHRLADKELRVHASAYYGYWHSLVHGWHNKNVQRCEEAVKLAQHTEDRALWGLHIGRHLYFQCIQSQYRVVCQGAKEDLQAAFAASDIHSYETCQFFRAWALLHLGQWSEMLAVLRDGEQMADKNQYPVWTMIFRLEKAWLYLQVGDWAHARELGEQGLAQALEVKHQYGQLLGCILLGWTHLGMEEWERALHYFNNVHYRPKRILMDWILRMPLYLGLSEYWLRQGQFARAGQAAHQLCILAAQPGERTYLALGRRMLAEIALTQRKWDEAETELAQAIAVLEGAEAPLAEWRVYATAARLHDQRRRKSEADQCWTHSAVVLQGLADLLGDEAELHHSLLTHPSVRTIFYRARISSLS